MTDAVDHVVLDGTTLLVKSVQAGKSVSEFTSGIRVGSATQDDRQHAFYNVLDDFSGGFGHRQLDIREALGTHWDNPGGADLRRSRHVTLPPARFVVRAEEEPTKLLLSSGILDGAAVAVPAATAALTDYFYYAAGNKVYRVDEDRDILDHLQTFATGGVIQGAASTEPEKMTRAFLHRGPLNVLRLYLVTMNSTVTSKMLYTEDPSSASPTWVEGVRGAWDAISVNVTSGTNIVIAQAITLEFMFSTDPKDGATDWNIDDASPSINPPRWIPTGICRFLGVSTLPTRPGVGIYFIDYGDGKLYALDYAIYMAIPVAIGDFHYITNGVIWEGQVVVTDGWDVWMYQPGGGGTEVVRKIGLFGRDGVPDSLREGRYRISGLIDGGRYLYAIAERTALDKAAVGSTLGFIILVYNGVGWSLHSEAIESPSASSAVAANPIAAIVDRYPLGVQGAVNLAKETSRALNILCQTHVTNAKTLQLYSFSLPKIGTVPIDGIDEFDGDPTIDHSFRTGWFDGGFSDLNGALYYAKIDLQSDGGTGSVRVGYRLDNDEEAPFKLLGVATERGNNEFQFDPVSEAGIEWRTAQLEITPQRAPTSMLSAGINDAVTSIPVNNLAYYPDRGVVQIGDEFIDYVGRLDGGSLYSEKNIGDEEITLSGTVQEKIPNLVVTLPDAGATYLILGKIHILCTTAPSSAAGIRSTLVIGTGGPSVDSDSMVAADDADGWEDGTRRTKMGVWLVTTSSDEEVYSLAAWKIDPAADGVFKIRPDESSIIAIKVGAGTYAQKSISGADLTLTQFANLVPNARVKLPNSGSTYLIIGKISARCTQAPTGDATVFSNLVEAGTANTVDSDWMQHSGDADNWSADTEATRIGVWLVTTSTPDEEYDLEAHKGADDGVFKLIAGRCSLTAFEIGSSYTEKVVASGDLSLTQTLQLIPNLTVTLPVSGATYLIIGKAHFQCVAVPSGITSVTADLVASGGVTTVDGDFILMTDAPDGWSTNTFRTMTGAWIVTTSETNEQYDLVGNKLQPDGTFIIDQTASSLTAIRLATDIPGLANEGDLLAAVRGARGSDAAAHTVGASVDCLNRTPELRGIAIVYSKKSPLRKTWVFQVDVNKMVEQGALVDTTGNGTPDTPATHQNVYDYLNALWDKQTLVQFSTPQAEPAVDNLRVQIADITVIMDDNRDANSVHSFINVTILEPVKAS